MKRSDLTAKYRALVEGLYTKTEEGKLIWEKAPWPTSGHNAQMGDFKVNIFSQDGQYEAEDVFIRILNDDNEEIESFSDGEVSKDGLRPSAGAFDNHYELMLYLYKVAQRVSKGADRALDNVLAALADD